MPFLILLFFAFLIAYYAKTQGKPFLFWFIFSCLFTPLVGFIGLIIYLKYAQAYKNQGRIQT
ncbi:hypothetical protein BSR56_05165 [Acinetobacter haemolyticus]|nr:hypothetical protein BSR56_05165 [Acinetobacter haemolyticus]